MAEQPAFMRKPTDITVYRLGVDTIPDLMEETGLTETQWLNVLSHDQQLGLQSKVYVIPSEVRWLALLQKLVEYTCDFDDPAWGAELSAAGFSREDVDLLKTVARKDE